MKVNLIYKFTFLMLIINNTMSCKYARNLHLKNPHIKHINNINRNLKNYDAAKVDWESVISGCHASFNYEKRLANFYIRAAAHDALAIHDGLGGSDGSVLLTQDELSRPENNYDSFTYKLSKNALALSKKFDTSVADIIAVCGAYAVTYLGGPQIITNNTNNTILVGRIDSDIPNPAHQLVPNDANTDLFNKYSIKFNFTLEEFTALLGSHTVIDDKSCLNKDQITYCDPLIESCTNISMFTWDNTYYKNLCNKNIIMKENSISINPKITKLEHIKNNLCKFTSKKFKDKIIQDIEIEDNLNTNEILGIDTEVDNINIDIAVEDNTNVDIAVEDNTNVDIAVEDNTNVDPAVVDNIDLAVEDNTNVDPAVVDNTDPVVVDNIDPAVVDNADPAVVDNTNVDLAVEDNANAVRLLRGTPNAVDNNIKKVKPDNLDKNIKKVKPDNLDKNVENLLNRKDNPNDIFNDEENLFTERMRVTVFEDNTHKLWPYTVNDAWLGQACQNKLNDSSYNKEIRKSMLQFQNNTDSWNEVYIRAYNKMINNNANWVNGRGFAITGLECHSGYKLINNKKICNTAFLPTDTFYE